MVVPFAQMATSARPFIVSFGTMAGGVAVIGITMPIASAVGEVVAERIRRRWWPRDNANAAGAQPGAAAPNGTATQAPPQGNGPMPSGAAFPV